MLLNALRSLAMQQVWGTGKLEARPEASIRIPLAQATDAAVRDLGHRHRDQDRVDTVAGVVKTFAQRTPMADRVGHRWRPPMEGLAAKGRADSGDLELDLTELFSDLAETTCARWRTWARAHRRRAGAHLRRGAGLGRKPQSLSPARDGLIK